MYFGRVESALYILTCKVLFSTLVKQYTVENYVADHFKRIMLVSIEEPAEVRKARSVTC
jgi:hypothetical protein